MRDAVFAGDRWVALLSFGASAWKLASRDAFIVKDVWLYPLRRDYGAQLRL